MSIDSPGDLVAIVSIAAAILGGILWLIRAQSAMMREFRPNGGHSLKDQVTRIERRVDNHIDNHHREQR